MNKRLEHFNLKYHQLMTPSVSIPQCEVNQEDPPGGTLRDRKEWALFSYSFNLSQQPAASVPCSFTCSGLPVGQRRGKFEHERILRACHTYMEARPSASPTCPTPPSLLNC